MFCIVSTAVCLLIALIKTIIRCRRMCPHHNSRQAGR